MSEFPDPARCPVEVIESFKRYIYEGIPLGDFLEAVVSDKLIESFGRADSRNRQALEHICAWVYEYMPIALRGPENYQRHLRAKAAERLQKEQA